MRGLERRLAVLEAEATAGKIPTTDENGARVWLEGSGLPLAFRLMKIQDEGRELPDDLRREAMLWSRADVTSQAEQMTKALCLEILA